METIYVALLERDPAAWVPVHAARRADGTFQIVSRNDDWESERWEFSSGSLVRCELRQLAGDMRLVAVEGVMPHGLRLVKA